MIKLENLSSNLIYILNQTVTSQNLCKLLYYNDKDALTQTDIANTSTLKMTKIYPYPFNTQATTESCSQLNIYYPEGEIKNRVIEYTDVYFDIVVAKELWLINDNKIRPYEILKEIFTLFYEEIITSVGKLIFGKFYHIPVNIKFDAIRIRAKIITV